MELLLLGGRVEFFLWMPASVIGTVVTCSIPNHFTVVEVQLRSRILSDGRHPSD